ALQFAARISYALGRLQAYAKPEPTSEKGCLMGENGKLRPSLFSGATLALALLLGINLFNYIDRYVLAALVPSIRVSLAARGEDTSSEQMGYLAPAFLVSYMLCAPIFGWLGDRTSRWKLITLGVVLWSLASGASGLAGTFTALFLTR